ncbi:MAG: tetratricopeptide repeat protein [Desulfovibrionaceae bacterium]|nr:tetratricopeptide repeat protein [Desulfovibrionaceae bacterium]
MQQYTSKDYEFLGKQVAAGRYVGRTTALLALVLFLLIGMCLGRYVFPYSSGLSAERGEKRPLGQSSGLADALNPNKQLLQAIFQHEEDLRKNPDDAEAWEHLGNLYFDAQEPEKAIRAYNRALELKPGSANILVDAGVMYRELKNYDMALEYFKKALTLDPKHQNALFNSGVLLYFDLNKKEDGLNSWRELVKINPNAKTPSGDPVSKLITDLS